MTQEVVVISNRFRSKLVLHRDRIIPPCDFHRVLRDESDCTKIEHCMVIWAEDKHVADYVEPLVSTAERLDMMHFCIELIRLRLDSESANLATVFVKRLEMSRGL